MNVLEQAIENRYAIYNGDSCEIVRAIPDNSIHYTIFSPPFASLYTYSNSDRDMGNSKGDDEFYDHFIFLARELFRVTMPGRLLSFHCISFHGYFQIVYSLFVITFFQLYADSTASQLNSGVWH